MFIVSNIISGVMILNEVMVIKIVVVISSQLGITFVRCIVLIVMILNMQYSSTISMM